MSNIVNKINSRNKIKEEFSKEHSGKKWDSNINQYINWLEDKILNSEKNG